METENIKEIIEKLKIRLKDKLPGDVPRSLLAPAYNGVNKIDAPSKSSKKSAVLLLLWEVNQKIHIVFTLRSLQLLSHSGQISFPGGQQENSETPIQTALRETYEEIGIPSNSIEILGELTPIYVLPSNSHIFPVVGYAKQYLDFRINKNEVEEVFYKPLTFFSFNNIKIGKWNIAGKEIDIPFWEVHPSVLLWGATAMILAELIEIYNNINVINV
jgi:8-oxo-dGTP pyrophosphatase MutT (NUDIX family)